MALKNILQRGFVIDKLIREKKTGSAKEPAETTGVTRRHIFNYLQALEEIGKKCRFDPEEDSYVYFDDTAGKDTGLH